MSDTTTADSRVENLAQAITSKLAADFSWSLSNVTTVTDALLIAQAFDMVAQSWRHHAERIRGEFRL